MVNSSRDAASAADFTSSVTIAPISLDGGAIIGGNGPVRVDSRLKNIRAALGPEERYWVRITVQVEDYLTAQMWDTTFKDIMNSGGIPLEWYETGTSGPGVSPATAYAYIKGPYDDTTHADVWLKLHPAEYAITFNNIASGIT